MAKRPTLLALMTATAAIAALIGAAYGSDQLGRLLPGWDASVALLGTILAAPIAWLCGRIFACGGRGAVAAGLALTGLVPVVAFAVAVAAGTDIVLGAHPSYSWGDAEFVTVAVGLSAVGAIIGALVSGAAAKQPSRDRLVRGVALAALVGSGLLLVRATVRTVRFPGPGAFAASLPIVGELTSRDYFDSTSPLPPPIVAGETTISRSAQCGELGFSTGQTQTTVKDTFLCDRLVIRRDVRHDLWVVESHTDPKRLTGDSRMDNYVPVMAFRPPDVEGIRVRPGDVADTLSPPHGWTLCALFSTAVAALAIAVARRRCRPALALAAGRPGRHTGDGWIELDEGGAPIHSAAAAAYPVGAALSCVTSAASAGGYRNGGRSVAATQVGLGTPAQHAVRARDVSAGGFAFAAGLLLLGMTPLLVELIARWS